VEKHITNKDIDDGCLYVEFERCGNVDMRKHHVHVGGVMSVKNYDFSTKEHA